MRIRYPLPDSPSYLRSSFERLCQPFPVDQVALLRKRVEQWIGQISNNKNYLGPNPQLARDLAVRCIELLERYEKIPEKRRPLVIGAILYLIAKNDIIPDPTPIVGFDDDVHVMNHVLERLGFEDLYLTT